MIDVTFKQGHFLNIKIPHHIKPPVPFECSLRHVSKTECPVPTSVPTLFRTIIHSCSNFAPFAINIESIRKKARKQKVTHRKIRQNRKMKKQKKQTLLLCQVHGRIFRQPLCVCRSRSVSIWMDIKVENRPGQVGSLGRIGPIPFHRICLSNRSNLEWIRARPVSLRLHEWFIVSCLTLVLSTETDFC